MGLSESRAIIFPEDIDEKYDQYKKLWTNEKITAFGVNQPVQGKATLKKNTLNKAIGLLESYLDINFEWIGNPKILEPYAGNGIGTKLFYDKLVQKFPNLIIKSTDIQDLSGHLDTQLSYPVEYGMNSVETIEKYGIEGYNILLMVSPPPSGTEPNYSDYFAIKKWTEITNTKLIVFVGELGASDGSEGLYQFLVVNNPDWDLDLREIIHKDKDVLGGFVEKEIFIFKRK